VREKHEVDRRQRLQLERRVGSASCRHTVPEVDVVSPVQVVRIGQNRKSGVAQDYGRVADEENGSLRAVGRSNISAEQNQFINPFISYLPFLRE
jgi:hypothetical protein